MDSGALRLAHRWTLVCRPGQAPGLVREFVRPAVRAVPSSLARRLGPCRISLHEEVEPGVASRWSLSERGLEVSVSTSGYEDHDIALELLTCLGQALWERLTQAEIREYWILLQEELAAGAEGEIDEQSLGEKRSLLTNRAHARSRQRLVRYGRTSFAGTTAEYIHSLWHDVTIRTGADFLPAVHLRRRLELLSRWFRPDRGYRLFSSGRTASTPST